MLTNIQRSTLVTFPSGCVEEQSNILAIFDFGDKQTLVVEQSPFHPVDKRWPDQPGDKGTVVIDGLQCAVENTILLLLQKDTKELFGSDQIQSKDRENYFHLVGHVLSEQLSNPDKLIGKAVTLQVDKEYRASLSLHHTFCHLAALALNSAMHSYFKKPVPLDSLGQYDFDKAVIQSSFIFPDRSEDTYRLGKSARKQLRTNDIVDELPTIKEKINETLAKLSHEGVRITVEPSKVELSVSRFWCCTFKNNRVAKIPCGGSHLLGDIKDFNVSVDFMTHTIDGAHEISMLVKKV